MRSVSAIAPDKFLDAFQKVGWKNQTSSSGRYFIWTSPEDDNLWTRLPVDPKAPDYGLYQEKNILLLLFALGLPEDHASIDDLRSQLNAYNYKLINRIIGKETSDTVPYELATSLPDKNIEAFRHFCLTRQKHKRAFPIEKFELNHTEVGSFVIPISLIVEDEVNATLIPKQNDVNILLHEYLSAIENMVHTPRENVDKFAERIISDAIDSRIVKDFLAKEGVSIAKLTNKYAQRISGLTIGGKESPLLDYMLDHKLREFKEIDLAGIETLDNEYIQAIEDLEVKLDDSRIDEKGIKIEVVVDGLDRNGSAKFTVVAIGGEEIKKPFKAMSNQLTKNKLDECAKSFAKDDILVVTGDIAKSKGKLGSIIIDTFDIVNSADGPQSTLFS